MACRRSSRHSRPPTWTVDYEVDQRDDLMEDEWSVETLLEVREEQDSNSGRKRRQYLVEWEGDFDSTWVDEEDVSPDLKRRYHEGERRVERELKRVVRAVVRRTRSITTMYSS